MEHLVLSLKRRSVVVDIETLSAAVSESLQESAELSSEPLSAGERDFLLEHTDLVEADLSETARTTTRARIVHDRAESQARMMESSLTTAEVAALTGRQESGVRHSARKKDLFVLNPADPKGQRFPTWQFVDGSALPGIARILEAFPVGTHPLTIETFMTTARESLQGRTPAEWLATDGPVDVIAQLADEKGRE